MLDFKGKKVGAILSCNEIQKYIDWIPYAAKAWENNGAVPVIILVNHDVIPENLKVEGWDVRLLPKIEGILSSYQAQIVRQFYAGILVEYDAVITSDLDTICLPSKTFFERYINESIEDNKFIATRYNHPEIFIPWNVAPPKIWSEVMGGINTVEDVVTYIKSIFEQGGGYQNVNNFKHPNVYYTIDQMVLTKQVFEYAMDKNTQGKGQVNGIIQTSITPDMDWAHHRNYMVPYINNNKVKIIDKLDLFQSYITEDGKVIEAGTYQWNNNDKKEITLEDLNPERHICLGTGNATNFSKEILDWTLNNLWK
ncbi:hypothetical protein OAA15_00560 [bacterium]|nr:hypothetical protein [bacterium]